MRMKRILSVIILTFLSLATIEAATFYVHAAAKVASEAQGMGYVCVSTSSAIPQNGWAELFSADLSFNGTAGQVSSNVLYYHAKAKDGYYFAGWSTIDGNSDLGTSVAPTSVTPSDVNDTESSPVTGLPVYYAMFKPLVNVIQHDKMIRYLNEGVENINNASIIVETQVSSVKFTLRGENIGLFALINPQSAQKAATVDVNAKQGLAHVELQYLGDYRDALGKTVDIDITAGGHSRTITTTIEDCPTLNFLPTHSAYTVKHTNGTGKTYTIAQNAANATTTQITEESMLTVELSLNQATSGDYVFIGWQEITQDANGNEIVKYISYDKDCVHKFSGSAQVRPEFVLYTVATFFIQSQADKHIAYHDFNLAMSDAEKLYKLTGNEQVVIFENVYTIRGYSNSNSTYKEGTLASGNYTIPKGVTLLVPGDANYTVLLGDAGTDNVEPKSTFELNKKLILDEATNIIVNGNICVYATLSTSQGTNGRPNKFGQIHMENNARIIANSGAGVYVFGYITGDPDNSYVEMRSGSIVYEAFQVGDFRGGTAISGMLGNNNKVFPVSQYYVQSIETRLILEYGAIEKVSCPADMTGVGELCANANLVLPSSSSESALFKLGVDNKLIKYYDKSTDRMKYIIEGGTATLDYISLDLGVAAMNSRDYVLPISSNMDISLHNTKLVVNYDVAFLAGSTLHVDYASEINISNGACMIVYDKEQHYIVTDKITYRELFSHKTYLEAGAYNYVYMNNVAVTPLLSRPNEGILYNRTTNDFSSKTVSNKTVSIPLNSATWTIDGKVSGAIYTTSDGANITSNGGGVVVVNNTSSTKKTYQGLQHAVVIGASSWVGKSVTYKEIPITIAKLKNTSDYTPGANGKTYVYDNAQGKWIENGTSTPVVDNNDYTPTFAVSSPLDFAAYVGKTGSKTATIKTQNANVNWTAVDWSYQITGLSANQFTSSAVTSSGCNVTFAPTSAGSAKTATLKIIASYVNNQQQYTYSKEVTLTGVAIANTNDLDFAISTIGTTSKTLFADGNGNPITITNKDALKPYVTITPNADNTNYSIAAINDVNTIITINATQASNGNVGVANISKVITVGSGKQALHVPLDIDNSNFADATWAKSSGVEFNGGVKLPANSQWTAFFTGTPDKLIFTPTTTAKWQIEEFDGKGWNVLYALGTITQDKEFTVSLNPTATKIRIRSIEGGTLTNVSITALSESKVKADVDALYIPKVSGSDTYTTSLLLTYLAENLVTLSTSNAALLKLDKTVLDPSKDAYKQEFITLTSKMQEPGEYRIVVRVGAEEKIIIPVIVYDVPQELPIVLKNDADANRFYYVTPLTQHATWNPDNRTIALKNNVGASAPSLTFAFSGAASYISFTPTEGYKGIWHLEQSVDGHNWWDATVASTKQSTNTIEYNVNHDAHYLRVSYDSYYTEEVILDNFMIVGEPSVLVNPMEMELIKGTPQSVNVTAVNLSAAPSFSVSDGFTLTDVSQNGSITNVATIVKNISYTGNAAIAYGTLTIIYPKSSSENSEVVVNLVGLSTELSTETGIWTGVDPDKYTIEGDFAEYEYHQVKITNAYVKDGEVDKTAFDYLIIYGETKPESGTEIKRPTSTTGSNAVTPCFIYKPNSNKSGYELHKYLENVNSAYKIQIEESDVIEVDGEMSVYISGFCPYASTGFTKTYEGVWHFKGQAGEVVNVYLEDCHIYSRNKTEDGHPFQSKADGNSFSEKYVRGSGAVLVFECNDENIGNHFQVKIHTRGDNLLKSNYGCFYDILGYRAYQVSAPVQIRMTDENYVAGSTTELSFDDIWPNSVARTNGYLALKKQVNNAPSIDMGNKNTIVNFNGGRVHLENAQIVSENYQTTLAICYRSGKMGGIEFTFAHGIGTDDVGGTVNFYDGTTTVEPMFVDAKYRQYYLMDEDNPATTDVDESTYTSCLRCPTNTYIYGGSHCMMRACQHTTSKGGAPKDKPGEYGIALGLYKYPYAEWSETKDGEIYTHKGGWTTNSNNAELVVPNYLPNGDYKVESITPNDNGTPDPNDDYLNLWVTDKYDSSVTPEVDKNTLYWSACMTQISAEMNGVGGTVGGETFIDANTEVQNLLYCKIDEEMYDAITADDYMAPVKIPSTTTYQRIPITVEGSREDGYQVYQNYITNGMSYEIKDKVYYITTASADIWTTFTAPFDVEKVYVIETFSEKELKKIKKTATESKYQAILKEQAKHNADFAAFYGVAMAIYNKSSIDFWNDIFKDYITWAKQEDQLVNVNSSGQPLYSGTGDYTLRGRYELEHYDGSNISSSHYYLYENVGDWELIDDGVYTPQWEFPDMSDNILMNKGKTYSMLFPYCTGCWDDAGKRTNPDMWDYWSGKFIIFESRAGGDEPHSINGANYISESKQSEQSWVFDRTLTENDKVILTGNSTFSLMSTDREDVYFYDAYPGDETFTLEADDDLIYPTSSFLYGNIPSNTFGMPAIKVTRDGKVIYGSSDDNSGNGTPTGEHIPTIGGDASMLVSAIEGGVNVTVFAPQYIRVVTITGNVIFSGFVQDDVNISLPTKGIYIVGGETEVKKILY